MKDRIYLLIASCLLLSATVGCKKYLDVAPDNIGTIDYAFRLRSEAEKYLATCYNSLPPFGQTWGDLGFFTGDEFAGPYPNGLGLDISLYRIARGEQSLVFPIGNRWDNFEGRSYFKAIRECNIFLENVVNVPDLSGFERKRWVAEVKFLKAYYHYILLRMYGPIPVTKVNLPIYASIDEVRVTRQPVDSAVNYIVSLLDEAALDLQPVIGNEASELGRITSVIALSVKAQVLMTAASPQFNGNVDYSNLKNNDGLSLVNTTYDPEKWVRAAEACKAAIDLAETKGGAKLYYYIPESGDVASDSTRLTMNIRGIFSEKWNPEIIWGASNSYAFETQRLAQARLISGDPASVPTPPTTNESIRSLLAVPMHIAEMFYSNNGVPIEEDKDYDYNNRISRLRIAGDADRYYLQKDYTTVQLNFDREPRYYADLGFDGGTWFGQGLFNDTKTWHMEAKAGQLGARLGSTNYTVTGYLPKKLVNYKNDFGSNSAGYNIVGYPWPVLRLAELYLWYAEALNEVSGPGAQVYQYLDIVRARAGLKGVVESWSAHSRNAGKPGTKDGLRNIIQQETLIEEAFEGKRFWDLRRWKRAAEYLNMPIRGWDLEQEDAENYYRPRQLFSPVFNVKDYLWPISESAIVVNPNLVQNPGW